MDFSDVISVGALLVAGGGLCFTWQSSRRSKRAEERALAAEMRSDASEKRAIEAAEKAERQEKHALWGRAVTALNELVTCDARSQEVRSRLTQLRISLTELGDGLNQEVYPGLDEYFALTHGITALHYDRSLAQMEGKPSTTEVIWEAHKPIVDWLSACIQNFRLLRSSEPGPELMEQLGQSLANYREVHQQLKERASFRDGE